MKGDERKMEGGVDNILMAFIFTACAGLATAIGGLVVIFAKEDNTKMLSFSLGFSAGVMVFVALTEIYPKALESISMEYSDKMAMLITAISFFGGIGIIALIDRFTPEAINPHEVKGSAKVKASAEKNKGLLKMGMFTALAIAIHNFPEGIATFMSVIIDPTIAIPIVVAIAIHNVPEGMAVAMPVYYATGKKGKAFLLATLSGLTEPIGALVGYAILLPFLTDTLFGIVFSAVAGIMVYISLDELLPTAEEYGHHHLSITGVVLGMMVMAVSIILLV